MTAQRDDYVPHEIALAGALFGTVSKLIKTPSDGIYADCLLALAFKNLLTGLHSLSDEQIRTPAIWAHLEIVAHAIEDCAWLSDAVRTHLSKNLRALRDDKIARELVIQFVIGAANRIAHAQVIDCMRAIGSDGLGNLAGVMQALAAPAVAEAH